MMEGFETDRESLHGRALEIQEHFEAMGIRCILGYEKNANDQR
jgi:hypothetical protein